VHRSFILWFFLALVDLVLRQPNQTTARRQQL